MLMKDILEKAGVEIRSEGDNYLLCVCPFHKDIHPSLSVNKYGGYFNCFGCGEHGNYIELIEKLKVKATFIPKLSPPRKSEIITDLSKFWRGKRVEKFRKNRNFSREIIQQFEVLEDNEFLIFPIRDKNNKILGIIKRIGRVFYTYLPRGGVLYGAQFIKRGKEVILTEGITDVMRATEYGYQAVGLLTNRISVKQKRVLSTLTDKVIIALDYDPSGRQGSIQVYNSLKGSVDIFVVRLSENKKDLGQLTKKEMEEMMKTRKSFLVARLTT